MLTVVSLVGRIVGLFALLMLLPLVITGALMLMSPGYMDPMVQTPMGLAMVAVAALLFTAGGLWLRKVVQFKF